MKVFTDEQRSLLEEWLYHKEFYLTLSAAQQAYIRIFIKKDQLKYGPNSANELNNIRDKWIKYIKNRK